MVREIVAIVGEALARIIELTPVDSGKARGGWGVTVAGTGSEDPVSLPAPDKDGATTLRNGLTELLGYGRGGRFRLSQSTTARPTSTSSNTVREALRRTQWFRSYWLN